MEGVASLRMRNLLQAAGCLGAFAVGACGGAATTSHGGTVVVATAADAETLFPPLGRALSTKTVTDVLFDKLAEIGPALNTVGDAGFAPRLAQRWDWSNDSLRLTFHLDPHARWHDGVPLRASDVRFAFSIYTDPAVGASGGEELSLALDSISVVDSVSCTAWFKRRSPEQFLTLVFNLVPLPEHLLGRTPRDSLKTSPFARLPVGSGPFRLVSWEPRVRIEVAAVDAFYRGRPKLDRVIWSIAPDMSGAVRKLLAGEADFLEQLPIDAAAVAVKRPDLKVVPYGWFDYGFLRFNLRDGAKNRPHPMFGERAVRRALSMALDRRLMVRSVFDSLAKVGLGPFVRAQWTSDSSLVQLPFDRAAAARTLDSLGWRAGPDGVREKDSRPFSFTLLFPASSRNRQRYGVLIQEQLRQLGVTVKLEALDFNAFRARMDKHEFEAVLDGTHPDPSPRGIRESWTSRGIDAASGRNLGAYANPVFDAQVDSAFALLDAPSAKARFRAAYQTIIDDAPAIWLFEQAAIAGMTSRLRTGPLRADAWWLGLSSWSISP